MRKSLKCPKCSGRKILAVDAIADKNLSNHASSIMSIGATPVRPTWSNGSTWRNKGQFSCCICAACGYVEWFVNSASSIPVDGKDVRVLSDPDSTSPYR